MDKFEEASEGWQTLFLKYPTVGDIILQHLDSESALACRLVCKDWRPFINTCRPLWDKIRRTSLSKAAEEGSLLTAEVLIAKGANLNQLDTNLETPLHGAVREGHLRMTLLLLTNGARWPLNAEIKMPV